MAQGILDTNHLHHIALNTLPFSGLDSREKETFFSGGNLYSYKKKDVIFRQGDPLEYFYIVTDGIVQEFTRTNNGHEITQDIHMNGAILCKAELFLQEGIHHTEAVAVSDVYVMELPVKPFRERLLKSPAAAQAFLHLLAQHSFAKQTEIEQKVTMDTAEIVASFLRQLCKEHGLNPRGFTLPYKKSLIASRLGIELETFSRTLPKLKKHGVTVKGTQVIFHDPASTAANVPTSAPEKRPIQERPSAVIIPWRRVA